VRGAARPLRGGGVLAAAIGVVDQPRRRAAGAQGHGERVEGQRRAQVVGQRPADDAPRVRVAQHGEGQPARTRRQLRAVAEPEAVRPRRREVARHQVRRGDVRWRRDGRAGASPPVTADAPGRVPQAGHALAGTADTVRPQRRRHPRRARRPAAARIRGGDVRRHGLVGPGAGRDPAARPGVVGRAGHIQDPAQQRERRVRPLRAAGPLAAHTVACAQEAAAFRRSSRSCRSVCTSRRSRRNSSRSSVVRSPGCPRPASASSCRSQWRSASDDTPRSAASAGIDFSLPRAKRTASARNSGG